MPMINGKRICRRCGKEIKGLYCNSERCSKRRAKANAAARNRRAACGPRSRKIGIAHTALFTWVTPSISAGGGPLPVNASACPPAHTGE